MVASLFSDELQELFEVIEKAHNKYQKDISPDELIALWKDTYPIATRAETGALIELVDEIRHIEPMSDEVTSDIIDGLWKRNLGRQIGNLGIAISEGRHEAFDKLKKLIDQVDSEFKPDDFGEYITDDIVELLALNNVSHRWTFNINALSSRIPGFGAGDFIIVFARPETGKTAFAVSLALSPNGWLDQGAKIMYLANEELGHKTKLRAVQARAGMTEKEVIANPKKAQKVYKDIAERFIIHDTHMWDTHKVEAFVELHKPDILIIDQIDKVHIDSDEANHARLKELYIWFRTYIAKNKIAGIGLTQASADAEHRTIITPDMMEGSKTGKYAEGDIIIGIGKLENNPDGTPEVMRWLNICKNKINGFHGVEICKIEPEISRYVN